MAFAYRLATRVYRLVAFAYQHATCVYRLAPRVDRLVSFVDRLVPFLAEGKKGKARRFVTAFLHNPLRDRNLVPNGLHTKTYDAVAAPSNLF